MTPVTLTRVGSTLLYQPPPPDAGFIAFMLWEAGDTPPASITSTDTWSAHGPPAHPGWYLFLDAATVDAAFEKALRGALGGPSLTSFAWVRYAGGSLTVLMTVALAQGGQGGPVLAQDVPIVLPPGVRGLTLLEGAPVFARGDVEGFEFSYPPGSRLPPPTGRGAGVPLSGSGAGALGFRGLVDTGNPSHGAVRKTLLLVQVDPLRPFDGARTFQVFTGRDYLLVGSGGRYRLEAV
jgi:hypothetical protein